MTRVQKIFDLLGSALFFLCLVFVVLGGFWIFVQDRQIEIGKLNFWGVALAVVLIVLARKQEQSRTWRHLHALVNWGLRPLSWQRVLIWLGFALFVMLAAHVARHLTLNTHFFDMGIVHNTLFFPFEGKFLSCAVCRNETYLGEHMSWTMILIAPVTALLKSDVFVFALQKIIPLGIWFAFLMKGPLRHRPELRWWWFFFAFANPGFRSGLLFDFREDVWAYSFLFLAAWSLSEGLIVAFFLAVFGALLSKENVFATTFMMAPLILLTPHCPWTKKQRRWVAGGVALLSIVYAAVCFKILMPHFLGGASQTALLARLPGMGGSVGELIENAAHHPVEFLRNFMGNALTPRTPVYLFVLLAVGIFWSRFSWPWLLPAIPGIFFNLISAEPGQRSLGFHYDMVNVVWLSFAICFGLLSEAQRKNHLRQKIAWAFVLSLCTFNRSPLYYAFGNLLHDSKRISFVWQAAAIQPTPPVAGDFYTLTAFTHIKELRFFYTPTASSASRVDQIREFVRINPRLDRLSEGRDPRDAKSWVLRLDDQNQAWLRDELVRLGGREVPGAMSNSEFAVIEVGQNPFEAWCKENQICTEGF